MKKEPKNVIFQYDFKPLFDSLSLNEKGKLVDAIFAWLEGEEPKLADEKSRLVWDFLRAQFKKDHESYIQRCQQNIENARKRWESCDRMPPHAIDAIASDSMRLMPPHAIDANTIQCNYNTKQYKENPIPEPTYYDDEIERAARNQKEAMRQYRERQDKEEAEWAAKKKAQEGARA